MATEVALAVSVPVAGAQSVSVDGWQNEAVARAFVVADTSAKTSRPLAATAPAMRAMSREGRLCPPRRLRREVMSRQIRPSP